ncbi:MAG: hypothetical protein J6K39_02620 [Clostridia bacterium]|nr:hypothetical protein [Clostridia bacterium]
MKYFFKQLLKVPMLWVFAFMIAIFGFAALGKRAEVNTFAVVTAVGIDRTQEEDNAYEVSLLTFIPVAEQTFAESYKVVSAKGRSVAEAMDFAGLFLGRQVGLSHLNIVVLNQALFDDDVSIYLDYLSRNKHVSSSTKLVATDKTAKEFLQAAQKLDTESSIKVGDLISFNSEYIYAADTSFETFFKGTFCPTRVGMMSLLSTGQTSKGQISSNPNSGETAKGEQSSGGEKGAAGSGSQGAEAE